MTEKEAPPLCSRCKFYNQAGGGICMRPETLGFDPIHGTTYPYARDMRLGGECGYDGKLFTAPENKIAWPMVILFVMGALVATRIIVHLIFGVWIP